jgi:DNA-binding NarL/FixJ family response regulator
VRVVIGEDEALLREGLTHVLEHAGFTVVATAADAPGLLRATAEHRPDLVVTDIRMPPQHADDGLLAALEVHRTWPATAIVVLSQHVQRRYAVELLGERPAGVGYLLKQRVADGASFCTDLERIGNGAAVLDPEVVRAMLARPGRDAAIERLTPRQREVLALMAEGRSNAGIAERLVLSERAVVRHVNHIYQQLDLRPDADDHRRVLAVVRYLSR